MTTPGRDEKPIFEAEKAPPTAWEQIVSALRPRRSSTPAHPNPAPPQGTRNVLIAIGTSLVGAIGGVLLILGALGVGMSLLLIVTLVVTRIQGLEAGIQWPVVPVSLLIFGVLGAVGYVLLRWTGMFAARRSGRSRVRRS
ncbi:MAG TPA: hypothetical protein VIK12_04825 [Pengzhenrongella sp.]